MPITRRSLLSAISAPHVALVGSDAPPLDNQPSGHSLHTGHVRPPSGSESAYRRFTDEMHVGMEKMMRDMHSDPPSGDPDIDFLVMMIPHHWGATEMARLVLRHGRDPLVREIAETILATQIGEIKGMRGRLSALRASSQLYPSLTGNRGGIQK